MLPEGWRQCRMGDLFESRRERGRPGLPLLSVTMNDGLVDREDLDRKQDSALTPEEHLLVKQGDIAYNMMRMWQGAFGLSDREGMVSPAYVVLKPRSGTNSEFAAHLLKSDRLRYLLWAYSYGITDDRLRLYYQDFAAIRVRIPDPRRQEGVARALSSLDSAIATVEKLIAVQQQEKRALMRRHFAPTHARQWRDHGWRRLQLGEIADIDRKSLSAATAKDFRFRYISLADIGDGRIRDTLEEHEFSTAPSRARRLVDPGDVLMATVRPNLKSYAIVGEEHRGLVASTGFAVITCKQEVLPEYLYQYLFSDDVQRQINALVAGSNYPAIGSSDVAELLLNVPDEAEQAKLARFFGMQDNKISVLEKYAERLRQERRALSQRLLVERPLLEPK
jgi:type I restriction enzyme, S subunit